MPNPIGNALLQACNPLTEHVRLQQLSQWKRRHERSQLRQAIATNLNCDENLLLELAAEYPQEVCSNPRFQLLLLSGESWREDSELSALLMPLSELGPSAPPQMRRDFLDKAGSQLSSTDPLLINKEWHMGFSQEITIEWQPNMTENGPEKEIVESDNEGEEGDLTDAFPKNYADHVECQEQRFIVEFACVVKENYFFRKPPYSLDDPLRCIEALVEADSNEDLLIALEAHGWEDESETTPGGQGYWAIESLTPELVDWGFDANLLGDGSGIIQVTDPSGKIHEVPVEAPDDYGDEYLNPTLEDSPDFIASIFVDSGKTTAELCNLLRKLIAVERQSGATDSNPCQP